MHLAAIRQGIATPGIVTSCGLRVLTASVEHILFRQSLLDSPTWITGTLDAVYLIISGGVVPGGIARDMVCDTDTFGRSQSGYWPSAESRS